jgi:hypothetical protein
VSRLVLACGSGIEHDDVTRSHPLEQVSHADRGRLRPIPEMQVHQSLEICEATLGDAANRRTELEHGWLCQAVVHEQSLFAAVHQRGLPQGLKVL